MAPIYYISEKIAKVIFSKAETSYLISDSEDTLLISILVGLRPANSSQNSSIVNARVFNTSPSKSALLHYDGFSLFDLP